MPLDIVHTESSLGWGGQEIRILTEAQGLIRRGHKVRLLCPGEARIYAEASRFGVPVEALAIGRKNLTGLTAMLHWLRSHAGEPAKRVLNTHSSTDSWLAALALRLLGNPVPIVRTRHISASVPRNRMSRWLYQSAAAKVVTTGETVGRHLVNDIGVDPEKVQSIPTGVDTAHFVPGDRDAMRAQLGLPNDKRLVGIVATLRSWKGHRYLIEAFAGLPSDTGLVIVGDGPQREALETQVMARGVVDRVWMVGNQADVVPWLKALDVFCLPSYANEGVPQGLIQAMLVSLPCVTTAAGSIGELAHNEKTALVVPMQDAEALRQALARLLVDGGLRKELGAAARANCLEKHSLDRMLDEMERVFQQVIEMSVTSRQNRPRTGQSQ